MSRRLWRGCPSGPPGGSLPLLVKVNHRDRTEIVHFDDSPASFKARRKVLSERFSNSLLTVQ